MPKNKSLAILSLIFSLTLIFSFSPLILPANLFAQDESVTFTTYYPSPYGDYNNLTTNNFIARENVTLANETWGRVGIGTASPQRKLHVNGGDIGMDANYKIQGLVTNPSYGNTVEFYNGQTGNMNFVINTPLASSAFTFMGQGVSNGNVGIGTTDPGLRKLKVQGDMEVTGNIYGKGTVPAGAIMMFKTSCPSGWNRVTDLDNRVPRGASSYGNPGGIHTHSHATAAHILTINEMPSHSHTLPSGDYLGYGSYLHRSNSPNAGLSTASEGDSQPHSHGDTNPSSSWPPYYYVIWCEKI